MAKNTQAKRFPLEGNAKILVTLAALVTLAVWLMVGYYYQQLPNTIPTHYGLNGQPDAYGSRLVVLIEPLILTALVAGSMLVLRFRYTLLFRYPYMIRLPAFVYQLESGTSAETKGRLLTRSSRYTRYRCS